MPVPPEVAGATSFMIAGNTNAAAQMIAIPEDTDNIA